MKHLTSYLAGGLGGFLWMLAPMASAQVNAANPALPPSYLGPQLIVWSQMEKPKPVPQPLPDPPKQSTESSTTAADPVQHASLTLTGTIVKENGTYVLKVSGGDPYELEPQLKVQEYENKKVQVGGSVDEGNEHRLRVVTIDVIL